MAWITGRKVGPAQLAAGAPHMGIVVAASNSMAKLKSTADYTCSGTADDVTINAALSAAGPLKLPVYLMAGTYAITDTLLPTYTVGENTVHGCYGLVGVGRVILDATSWGASAADNWVIDFRQPETYGLEPPLQNLYIDCNDYARGVLVKGGKSHEIKNLRIVEPRDMGLLVAGAYFSTVRNIHIWDAVGIAIAADGGGFWTVDHINLRGDAPAANSRPMYYFTVSAADSSKVVEGAATGSVAATLMVINEAEGNAVWAVLTAGSAPANGEVFTQGSDTWTVATAPVNMSSCAAFNGCSQGTIANLNLEHVTYADWGPAVKLYSINYSTVDGIRFENTTGKPATVAVEVNTVRQMTLRNLMCSNKVEADPTTDVLSLYNVRSSSFDNIYGMYVYDSEATTSIVDVGSSCKNITIGHLRHAGTAPTYFVKGTRERYQMLGDESHPQVKVQDADSVVDYARYHNGVLSAYFASEAFTFADGADRGDNIKICGLAAGKYRMSYASLQIDTANSAHLTAAGADSDYNVSVGQSKAEAADGAALSDTAVNVLASQDVEIGTGKTLSFTENTTAATLDGAAGDGGIFVNVGVTDAQIDASETGTVTLTGRLTVLLEPVY